MTLLKLNNQNMLHINLIFVILSTMFVNLTTAKFYQDCGKYSIILKILLIS